MIRIFKHRIERKGHTWTCCVGACFRTLAHISFHTICKRRNGNAFGMLLSSTHQLIAASHPCHVNFSRTRAFKAASCTELGTCFDIQQSWRISWTLQTPGKENVTIWTDYWAMGHNMVLTYWETTCKGQQVLSVKDTMAKTADAATCISVSSVTSSFLRIHSNFANPFLWMNLTNISSFYIKTIQRGLPKVTWLVVRATRRKRSKCNVCCFPTIAWATHLVTGQISQNGAESCHYRFCIQIHSIKP